MERRIILSYIGFQFLFRFSFSFVMAIYVLFLEENQMTGLQIGFVNWSFMIATVILEIPTGIVADIFGRKVSVVAGVFVASFGMFVYFMSRTFAWFVVAEVTIGLAHCLMSGALEAWLKDSLDLNGSEKKFGVIFSQGEVISKVGTLVGGAAGAAVGIYSLRLPWLIGAIGVGICGLITARKMQEERLQSEKFSIGSGWQQMRKIAIDSLQYGYKNKMIWQMLMVSFFLAFGMQALNLQWSLLFKEKIGLWVVSITWMGINLAIMAGSYLSSRVLERDGQEGRLILYSLATTTTFVVLAAIASNGWLILTWFWLHEFGRGVVRPASESFIQNNIAESDKRATISSFHGMAVHLGSGIGWILSGWLMDYIEIQQCWMLSSLVVLIATVLAFGLGKK